MKDIDELISRIKYSASINNGITTFIIGIHQILSEIKDIESLKTFNKNIAIRINEICTALEDLNYY